MDFDGRGACCFGKEVSLGPGKVGEVPVRDFLNEEFPSVKHLARDTQKAPLKMSGLLY